LPRVVDDIPVEVELVIEEKRQQEGRGMVIAVTLFRLKPERTIEEYRTFSSEVIGPGKRQLPSCISFLDGASLRQMGGTPAGGDGLEIEIIRITSSEEFEADHEVPPGKEIAAVGDGRTAVPRSDCAPHWAPPESCETWDGYDPLRQGLLSWTAVLRG
jgi:hypothetical protein